MPYELEGLIIYSDKSTEKCTLSIKNSLNGKCDINDFINGTYPVKLILRPLSDLTKEIEHNGDCSELESFNVLDRIRVIEKLYEWHLDLHSLIEKKLAIDKNTLK